MQTHATHLGARPTQRGPVWLYRLDCVDPVASSLCNPVASRVLKDIAGHPATQVYIACELRLWCKTPTPLLSHQRFCRTCRIKGKLPGSCFILNCMQVQPNRQLLGPNPHIVLSGYTSAFKCGRLHCAPIAQLVEHAVSCGEVQSSNLCGSSGIPLVLFLTI